MACLVRDDAFERGPHVGIGRVGSRDPGHVSAECFRRATFASAGRRQRGEIIGERKLVRFVDVTSASSAVDLKLTLVDRPSRGSGRATGRRLH